MRSLTAEQKAALRDPKTRVVNLVEMGHPTGTQYLWSGTGTLTYNGNDYFGCGLFGAITGVEQASDPRITQIAFIAAGAPADVLDVVEEDLKGYQATISMALVTPDDRVIGAALPVDTVDLDTQSTDASEDGTFTIAVTGQSAFWQLEKPSMLVWSSESQKAEYSDDTGMDALTTLEDLDITWTPT